MSKRSSVSIKKAILKLLFTGQTYSYAELERKINTGYRSIVANCKELENFGAIKIQKLDKHEANGKPYFQVSITNNGRGIHKKMQLQSWGR